MTSIRWPAELTPEVAHVHARNHLDTKLAAEELWPTLLRAGDWSSWYGNCWRLRFENDEGPDLRLGSVFSWWTFGVPVRTTVTELVTHRTLAWRGTGLGAEGYHVWQLRPLPGGGTRLLTEETQRGLVPWLGRWFLRHGLQYWHQRWLEGLVRAASGR